MPARIAVMENMNTLPRFFLSLLLIALLSGCAATSPIPDERDPLEGFNRTMYNFNDALDRAILKPVAKGYQAVTPKPVDDGISNFFSNIGDIFVLVNDLLQFKFHQAAQDFSRITFNTTFGLFGFIDVASHMDLPKHNEDFGQTLGYWGVGPGPYLVLPLLGPSTLRDGTGLLVDNSYDPKNNITPKSAYWSTMAVYAIDTRADLLSTTDLMEKSGVDPYLFLRDAYLQRRKSLVYDGNPPQEELDPFADDPYMNPFNDPTADPAPTQ